MNRVTRGVGRSRTKRLGSFTNWRGFRLQTVYSRLQTTFTIVCNRCNSVCKFLLINYYVHCARGCAHACRGCVLLHGPRAAAHACMRVARSMRVHAHHADCIESSLVLVMYCSCEDSSMHLSWFPIEMWLESDRYVNMNAPKSPK